MLNFLFFDDDPHAPSLFYFSYRRLIPNNLLFDGSYIAIADSPARLNEVWFAGLIVKRFANLADALAQRIIVNIFSVPETIQ